MHSITSHIRAQTHPVWHSRWTFVAAAGALAVGLGNFWRLAWATGEYGGGLYLLAYAIGLTVIAFPVLIAELVIGRRGRGSPLFSILQLRSQAHFGAGWYGIAPVAAVAALLLAATAVVVGSWLLIEARELASGRLTAASVELIAQQFPGRVLALEQARLWLAAFIAICMTLLVTTTAIGLGMLMRVLMVLIVVMTGAAAYAAFQFGHAWQALAQLLAFRPDDFGLAAIAHALVQSLLTLGIGLSVITAYGSYSPPDKSLIWQSAGVVILDFGIALLGGLIVVAVTSPHNIQPGGGYALLFVSMPYVFANIGFGDIIGGFYFAVLATVTATTVAALLEPGIAWLVERWRLPRLLAALFMAIPLAAGADLVLRGLLGEHRLMLLGLLPSDWIELVAATVIVPLVIFFTAVALGWRMPFAVLRREFEGFDLPFFWVWYPVLRYIVPPAVLLIFAAGIWQFFR